ncbi:MAG TPA: acetamidase/formamidase family protein [Bryobacteraceae bacterium]|nr:acetamidase/formamidase family protein [Bryobacteraceae bacterium]
MYRFAFAIVSLILLPRAWAQTGGIAGDWEFSLLQLGAPEYLRAHFEVQGDKVTGTIDRFPVLEGKFHNGIFEGKVAPEPRPSGPTAINNWTATFKGTLRGEDLTGEGADQDGPFTFKARRAPKSPGVRTHKFEPTQHYNYFTSKYPPVLRVFPGDSVETWAVDAGGRDQNGKRRSPGGNPLTGPFYVEGAWPGDTLVVKLTRLRLNSDKAGSGRQIVGSALTPNYNRNQKFEDNFSSEWKLDRAAGVARLAKPSDRLKNYEVKLKPMLGCIGVAPPQDQSFRSGWLNAWGGNMDYNQMTEGVTLYLPVYHPGALLFLGDGHAAQGDGELTGDALETSTEFTFTVDVIKGKNVPAPRAENAEYRMASGIANSLQDAVQQATTNLARWLIDDFKLNANEVAIVLGTAIRYDIAELVDPQLHVVAKIEKSVLAKITP